MSEYRNEDFDHEAADQCRPNADPSLRNFARKCIDYGRNKEASVAKKLSDELANERAFNEGWQEHIGDLLEAVRPLVKRYTYNSISKHWQFDAEEARKLMLAHDAALWALSNGKSSHSESPPNRSEAQTPSAGESAPVDQRYELARRLSHRYITGCLQGETFRFINFEGQQREFTLVGDPHDFSDGLMRLCDNVTGHLIDALKREPGD